MSLAETIRRSAFCARYLHPARNIFNEHYLQTMTRTFCMFYMLLWIAKWEVCTCREWHIGTNVNSISEIHHLLLDGDIIFIHGPEVLRDCVMAPLNMNLHIKGIGADHVRIQSLCQEDPKQTYIIQNNAALLHFSSDGNTTPNVSINNIEFLSGFILAANVRLQITNCIFNNSTIRFMGANETLSYDEGNFNFHGAQANWLLAIKENVCMYGALDLIDTFWEKTKVLKPITMTEASGLRQNIVVKCTVCSIKLKANNFGNRRLHIFSKESLALNATGLIFDGLNSSENKVGGISIVIPERQEKTQIRISNSTFSNLIPENIYFGKLFSSTIRTAPLAIFTSDTKPSGNPKDMQYDIIRIVKCNFTGNQRAIIFEALHIPVEIKSCSFRLNKVVIQGGAITTNATLLKIEDSVFTENEAGALDSYKIKSGDLFFRGPDKWPLVKFSSNGISMQHHFQISENRTAIKTYGKAGGGGALYVDGKVYIRNCSFEGNSAYDSGGAIYLTNRAEAEINDSYFVNPPGISSTLEGYLIFSVGEMLTLNNITLNVSLRAENDVDSSALFYFGRRGKCSLKNFQMHCPVDFKIGTFNSSSQRINIKSDIFIFDTLYYSCEKCENRYNLEGGWLRIDQQGTENEGSSAVLSVNPGSCQPCPYGGNCSISATAKPNYWGAEQNKTLKFYRCPKSYCCTGLDCSLYNTCSGNRDGKLCGKCAKGFTQTLFSAKCVPEIKCNHYYIIALVCFLGVAYNAFLMFQKDITNWLMSSPVVVHKKHSKETIKDHDADSKAVIRTISAEIGEQPTDICLKEAHINSSYITTEERPEGHESGVVESDPPEDKNLNVAVLSDQEEVTQKGNSGGSFLVLLFYYFQDAALIKIQTVYVKSNLHIESIEIVVSEIFRFRFNFFSLVAAEMCIFPGINMLQREFLLAIFVPLLIVISGLMHLLFKYIYKLTQREFCNGLALRALSALVLGLLFSYQKLAVTSMSFLYCVPVMNSSILFLDGNVDCYETWQYVTFLYVTVCIFPFSIHLAVAPAFLERGWITVREFIMASIIPLPFIISWIIRFRNRKEILDLDNSPEVETIVLILQGPYRIFRLPGILKSFCWSGMIMARRLGLMISKTFITNTLSSVTVSFTICILAMLQHVVVKPYKDSLSNLAGTVSAGALVIVSCISLIRATFEAAERVPTGPTLDFMRQLDITESLVLVWIPLVGLAFLSAALCLRVSTKLFISPLARCITKRCRSV